MRSLGSYHRAEDEGGRSSSQNNHAKCSQCLQCPLSCSNSFVKCCKRTVAFDSAFFFSLKCSNEAVFAADFHPTDTNIIVTCGKSHLYFWTLEGNSLNKKQGLFEVNCTFSLSLPAWHMGGAGF